MRDRETKYLYVNCICDTLLVELLAIRLGEPATLAKSLVMAKPADCGSRCRPLFPHRMLRNTVSERLLFASWSASRPSLRDPLRPFAASSAIARNVFQHPDLGAPF